MNRDIKLCTFKNTNDLPCPDCFMWLLGIFDTLIYVTSNSLEWPIWPLNWMLQHQFCQCIVENGICQCLHWWKVLKEFWVLKSKFFNLLLPILINGGDQSWVKEEQVFTFLLPFFLTVIFLVTVKKNKK